MSTEVPEPRDPNDLVTLEYIITKGEFTNSTDFSIHIEKQAVNRGIGYFETLLDYCEQNGIEPVAVASFINTSLKEKIKAEAEDMNLLKKKRSNKLPS